tara:strand:+ start:578 stop:1477 length:900 start_codon:yes stop_codon:yes gene_type:complete
MDANENNQNPDTPANQGSETLSVEEAFFTSEEQQAQQEVVGTPTEGTPAGEEAQINTEVAQDKNDERRFQYWQSEADKAKNENAQLRAQVQQMSQAQQVNQAPVQEEKAEEFPPPPEKPKTPHGFNRAEALEDPGSKSAQYLNELDEWRDNIIQYNSLKSDYQAALINEQMQKQEDRRKTAIANQQAYQQQRAQMNEVYNRVQGEYGLSNEEATEFVQTMSSPESLTMDNLVQLYRMQKGSGQTTQPAGPSDTFNQQARAQQVPSPMGVLPAQSNEQNVSQEEQIMDSIISGYKKNNPW